MKKSKIGKNGVYSAKTAQKKMILSFTAVYINMEYILLLFFCQLQIMVFLVPNLLPITYISHIKPWRLFKSIEKTYITEFFHRPDNQSTLFLLECVLHLLFFETRTFYDVLDNVTTDIHYHNLLPFLP